MITFYDHKNVQQYNYSIGRTVNLLSSFYVVKLILNQKNLLAFDFKCSLSLKGQNLIICCQSTSLQSFIP